MRVVWDETLKKLAGCRVELRSKKKKVFGEIWDRSFGEIWLKGKFEALPNSCKCNEFCFVRMFKDDSSKPVSKISRKFDIRPLPPSHVEARLRSEMKKGSVVDVPRVDEWWTGIVIQMIDEDDKVLVLLNSPPDIVKIEREYLRPHIDWVQDKYWVVARYGKVILNRVTKESAFSSGTMVEVRCKRKKVEVIWVPVMIVKEADKVNEENAEESEDEIEEDAEETDEEESDKKRFIVKFCDKSLRYRGNNARPNKTFDVRCIRPAPPSLWVEEYQFLEDVEVFRGTGWHQGRVMRNLLEQRYMVHFEATDEELVFRHSDLRPLKLWEDGVWKTKESPLTQPSGSNCDLLCLQAETETQGNTSSRTLALMSNQSGPGNHSTGENENGEHNNRKRKRVENHSFVASDTTTGLPFEKKLPIWKTFDSMEAFKTFPQSPHFSPLTEKSDTSREVSAIGMMFTFSGLLEEVKNLQLSNPKSAIETLNNSFTELEKHGFDVKAPQARIHKLLTLKDSQAEKMNSLKEIAETESLKVEIEQKILELQKMKEITEKKIAEIKPNAASITQQLEDVELQFQTTVSAPWLS